MNYSIRIDSAIQITAQSLSHPDNNLEFYSITDTRQDGQQGDLLPFLCFGVVGD